MSGLLFTLDAEEMAQHNVSLGPALVAALLAVYVFLPQAAEARCFALDGVRLWATGGAHGFKVTKRAGEERPPIGRLFEFNAAGREEPLWERRLVNHPNSVFVSDDLGTVVTVNTACGSDGKHALVLYGPDGRVVGDYAFDDIVVQTRWAGRVTVSSAGTYWAEGTRFAFEPDLRLRQFVITFSAGDQIRIDQTTGRIIAGDGVEVKPNRQ